MNINNDKYLLVFLVLFGYLFSTSSTIAQEKTDTDTSFMIACSPDSPIVYPNETVVLKAWVTSPTGAPLNYLWSVDIGKLKGDGTEALWDLTDVKPGIYNSKVQVTDQKKRTSECTLSVIVSLPPIKLRGGGYETGRSFLLPNQVEAEGYGLYSYLLLSSEPDDFTRERYLNAIIEYLKFPEITRLEKYLKRKELNITYLPLAIEPEKKILLELKEKNYKPVAEWVLKNYDYARSQALLHTRPGSHQAGPYIISFLKPLGSNPLSPPYLDQDQSAVPPDMVQMWMKYFLDQAAQERFWEEKTVKLFVLKLRTTIGIAAIGLPEVKKSLAEWISWKDKIS